MTVETLEPIEVESFEPESHNFSQIQRFYNPKVDYAFKRVFATPAGKRRLKSLLNSILNLQGDKQIQNLSVENGEALSGTPLGKLAIFDVHCTDQVGHKFIVEMQNRSHPDLHKRAGVYVARLYADQLKKGDKTYRNVKPVILVALLSQIDSRIPLGTDVIRKHLITEQETGLVLMPDMQWFYVHIGNFQKEEKDLSNMIEHWFHFLKNAQYLDHIPATAPMEVVEAYHEMEQCLWNDAERLAYDKSLLAIMDDDSFERAALQKEKAALQQGIAIGKEEGIAIGEVKGKAEGKAEGIFETAKKMKGQNIPIHLIVACTGLEVEVIQKLE